LTASVALFALTGCEMAPVHPPIQYTGDPIVDGNAELAAAPAKDRVALELLPRRHGAPSRSVR